jgi:hypothetical protein
VNPPHKKAADRYKDYANRFICTMEWPSKEDPSPVVLGVDADGAHLLEDDVVELWVKSVHRRWAGTPHVQYGQFLCLYLAPGEAGDRRGV